LIYEYAREHVRGSKEWAKLTEQYNPSDAAKRARALRKSFLSGELHHAIHSLFGNAKFLPMLAFYPAFLATPWQAVHPGLRRKEAEDFSERQSGVQSFQEDIALQITLERDLPEYARAGATDYDSWVLLDRCFHDETNQREYGFLALNWNYTDGELMERFRQWLAEKRGDRKPIKSQQGKNKTRNYLNALGAKRLLDSGLTAAQAIRHTEHFLKDGAGCPRPLYDSERGWSKAKNETVPAVLKRLFSD